MSWGIVITLTGSGEDRGRQLLSLYGNSGKYIFSLIQELGLDCSPQDSGFLAPARPGKALESLKGISAQWQSFGFDIQYLDEKSISRLSGLDLYGGAILDPNGGGVNPLAFARELARVCAEKGVKLYTRSRVTGFSRVGDSWRLKTSDGQLKAKKVILCAGGDNRGLHGDLGKSVMPLNVFQFSTEPLSEQIRETLLPDDHSLTDVHTDIFTMRFDRDGRLITACPAFLSFFALLPRSTTSRALDRMRKEGWVNRSPNTNDNRATNIYLSSTGRELAENVMRFGSRQLQRAVKGLSEEDLDNLASLLKHLVFNLSKLPIE